MKQDAQGGIPLSLETMPAEAATTRKDAGVRPDVGRIKVTAVLAVMLVFVLLTRGPVARPEPFEVDEFGFLDTIRQYHLPMHHTLFLAAGRVVGQWVGDPYRGFVVLDMAVSALALTSVWWWLRALVRPATAAAATLVLSVAPVFWSYGAMAGNYTAIPLVGSFLLGVAWRGRHDPRPWHPYAAAVVLALGTGYREDLGVFWLPIFLVILAQHRARATVGGLVLFTAINVAWLAAMLYDIGGWSAYRQASGQFAHSAGYLNSVWNLGIIDAPLRYAVKLIMALAWTLGPGLLFVPWGLWRLGAIPEGRFLAFLLILSVAPALTFHLLIHFGVAGYAFHEVPALLALVTLGAASPPTLPSPTRGEEGKKPWQHRSESPPPWWGRVEWGGSPGPLRLFVLAACLAALFWFYPTDYDHPGFRGSFDLAFARHTRIGLQTRPPWRSPEYWRTENSLHLGGAPW
jgi:hypothetical protein